MYLISNSNYVSTAALYSGEYLAHHGIKGQKWGIRRYQNPDGTLTAAGRKRYGVDLDISDVSRRNIARIRKGEAYRRLDVAKRNNPTNNTRIAELQGRVRSAKRAERLAKRVDKGARLQSKGQTISGNMMRTAVAYGAAALGSRLLAKHLSKRLLDLDSVGRSTPMHVKVAATIALLGTAAFNTAAYAYNIKKVNDNFNIRAYQSANRSNRSSKKYIGSQEYADVVQRRSGK